MNIKESYQFTTSILSVLKNCTGIIRDYNKGKDSVEIYKNVRLFADDLLRILEIDIDVSGEENLIQGPGIICPNHNSLLDIPAIFSFPGRKYFGAKIELYEYPLFGKAMEYAGMCKIDRSDREQAIRSLDEAAVRVIVESKDKSLNDSAYLIMFPEGTRSTLPDYEMLPFKKGAFVLSYNKQLPIIPVAGFGAKELVPKKSVVAKPGTMYLQIMDPLMPEDYYNPEDDSRVHRKESINDLLNDTRTRLETGIAELMQKHS
ncbi:1-acyl-sn-glycerol-3-phosphate acyltransferase [Candidatus Woesearchaeota archaeon]|nr:1-acyl-sn-glycerol-3-phosphate acyltransferase [Candidatus Woesearchaeota archaeon]